METLFGEDSSQTVSIRAFARSMGVSDMAIRKDIKSGAITAVIRDGRGKPHIIEAAAREEFLAAHPGRENGEDKGTGEVTALTAARIRKEEAQAAMAELDLAERNEEMFRIEDIETVMEPFLANCNALLEALTDQVVPLLMGSDPQDFREIIRAKVRRCQQELSGYDPSMFAKASRRRRKIKEKTDAAE